MDGQYVDALLRLLRAQLYALLVHGAAPVPVAAALDDVELAVACLPSYPGYRPGIERLQLTCSEIGPILRFYEVCRTYLMFLSGLSKTESDDLVTFLRSLGTSLRRVVAALELRGDAPTFTQ